MATGDPLADIQGRYCNYCGTMEALSPLPLACGHHSPKIDDVAPVEPLIAPELDRATSMACQPGQTSPRMESDDDDAPPLLAEAAAFPVCVPPRLVPAAQCISLTAACAPLAHSNAESEDKIPITLLTGFLGAGKSTLLEWVPGRGSNIVIISLTCHEQVHPDCRPWLQDRRVHEWCDARS